MIKGLKFAGIPVREQDEALAFYTNRLPCRVMTDQPFDDHQRWIELGLPGRQRVRSVVEVMWVRIACCNFRRSS
jgi:hypothetical protein